MTPQEKAKEIYNKFLNAQTAFVTHEHAKQCALIAVDEIIGLMYAGGSSPEFTNYYWQQVKEEIIKL